MNMCKDSINEMEQPEIEIQHLLNKEAQERTRRRTRTNTIYKNGEILHGAWSSWSAWSAWQTINHERS